MQVRKTRRGFRLIEADAVLSEVLELPGPTHSVFDLLAAAVAVLATGPRVALLGFAGGGLVAPLRAMGWAGRLDAVDLDPRGERLFRRISGDWCGEVGFEPREATDWLRASRRPYDLVIDDLSVPHRDRTTKPRISLDTLPRLIRRRLAPAGVAVVNTLAVPGMGWEALCGRLTAPYPQVREVRFEEFENRVLLAGERLPETRGLGRLLREALNGIGSDLGRGISVREANRRLAP